MIITNLYNMIQLSIQPTYTTGCHDTTIDSTNTNS